MLFRSQDAEGVPVFAGRANDCFAGRPNSDGARAVVFQLLFARVVFDALLVFQNPKANSLWGGRALSGGVRFIDSARFPAKR